MNRFWVRPVVRALICAIAVTFSLGILSCGEKETAYETNLLENWSFENVKDGLPEHWELREFRGLEGEQEIEYGVDETVASDGQRSWFFKGDPGSRRFYALTQEVEVRDITHVQLRGWMQIDQVKRHADQFAQCNFLVTFYDENHNRFQELRWADKRTRLRVGTIPWFMEDQMFRVPDGTRYIAVSCILGCDGRSWFDAVELLVPEPMAWQTRNTKNFVFHWLPARAFPQGSIETQQRLFDNFAERLGIESDVVIDYYLYPDTASIRDILSLKGYQYISWDDREIHTINPNENHEIIHFMMDVYGTPPKSIAEGMVFWLYGEWFGRPIDQVAAYHLSRGKLPTIEGFVDYSKYANTNGHYTIPAAASFVKFIVERWGTEKFVELCEQVNGCNSYSCFGVGFEKVYGVPCGTVEEQWRLGLERVEIEESSKLDPEQ